MNLNIYTLKRLVGFRRLAVAFGFGVLAALAFPPFNLVPILWLSFPALFLLLQSASLTKRSTFLVGWSFSFGLLVVSLYWIAGALFVDIGTFWWALPFAIAGIPAFLASFYGLAVLLPRWWGMQKVSSVFLLAFSWFLADFARSHVLTGFPWDITGYIWGSSLSVLQITRYIGIEGLTFLTLMLAVLPALFFVLADRRKATLFMLIGVLGLAALYIGGSWRLHFASYDAVPNVRVRLVQPYTEQSLKWDPQKRADNFEKLAALTFSPDGVDKVTHFIWPESATAYYLTEEDSMRAYLADLMPEGSVLLTGIIRRQLHEDKKPSYYNSLIAMNSQGHVVTGYDKHHLVPFGEYIPFREYLPLPLISTMGQAFSAGDGIRTVRAPNFPPFSGLVCYEAIFSGEVAEKEDPPELLVNVTNDAWYDGTIGPAQHFAIARVRAIEEGLPMIRVSNRGVTAVLDGYGRSWGLTGANKAGYVDSDLPVAIK